MKLGSYLESRKKNESLLDVILINPAPFYNVQYSHLNMGLLYMATLLRDNGFRVRCMGGQELFRSSLVKMKAVFTGSRPAIAGFYTISDNYYRVRKLAGNIRQWSPGTKIVVGGPLPTSIREKILDCPRFDMAVVGEGEFPLLQLAGHLVKGEGSLKDVPGLIYRDGEMIMQTPPLPPIADLDSLPFPDPALSILSDTFHLVSGRGCPHHCIFCFQDAHGLKYRYRSVDNLLAEIIKNVETHDFRFFDIIDDTFISSPPRVMEFSARLEEYRQKSRKDFVFFCQGRVDILDRHPEMLPALKRAGLVRMQVGLESGHPEALKIYKKKITVEQMKNVVRQVAGLGGVAMTGNFILGGPFEREETVEATLGVAKELVSIAPGLFETNANFLAPFPGTEIQRNPQKYGLRIIDETFARGLSSSDVHMESEQLDRNQLRQLRYRFCSQLADHMTSLVEAIPPRVLQDVFFWAFKYGMETMWFSPFLQRRGPLVSYFKFVFSSRFSRLRDIPPGQILEWTPMRVQDTIIYREDGSVDLPEAIGRHLLTDPAEILLYQLSSGKMEIKSLLEFFMEEMPGEEGPDSVLEKVVLPFFRKMESLYQVVFFK